LSGSGIGWVNSLSNTAHFYDRENNKPHGQGHLPFLLQNSIGDNWRLQKMKWIGPYKIDRLLDGMLTDHFSKPPDSDSVYLVSLKKWKKKPTANCKPIYVGSNISISPLFRKRVGDLIADMFGFFTDARKGHHSGGQSIYKFCRERKFNPKDLFIGWLKTCRCSRCAENKIYDSLNPERNKKRPARCNRHSNG
jgi:hypothetical protein